MDYNATSSHRSHCSNHGDYDSVLGCVCDDGWTGLGDFSTISGIHCDINTAAVTGLFYFVLFTNTVCMMMVARYLIVRLIGNRSLCSISLNPRSIFPVLFLAEMAVCSIFAITKIVYQDKQIVGRDLFITLIATLLPLCAQVGLVFYFFVVINCLKTYAIMMTDERRELLENRFAILSRICSMIPALSISFSIMPAVGLRYPRYSHSFAMIFHIGTGTTAWLYGIVAASAVRYLIIELQSHVDSFAQSSDDLQLVIKRLSGAYVVIIHNCFMTGFDSTIFGAYDYLLARSTYLFIVGIFGVPIGATVLMLTVSKLPRNNSRSVSVKKKFSFMRRRSSTILDFFLSLGSLSISSSTVIPTLGSTDALESHVSPAGVGTTPRTVDLGP